MYNINIRLYNTSYTIMIKIYLLRNLYTYDILQIVNLYSVLDIYMHKFKGYMISKRKKQFIYIYLLY